MDFDTGCGIWDGSMGGAGGNCLRLSKHNHLNIAFQKYIAQKLIQRENKYLFGVHVYDISLTNTDSVQKKLHLFFIGRGGGCFSRH